MNSERWDTPTIVVQQWSPPLNVPKPPLNVPKPTQSKTGTILVLVILVCVVLYYFCFIVNKN